MVLPDVSLLPYNMKLIEWLKEQRKNGAKLILATAAELRIAQAVFNHLGFFEEFFATENINLSAHHKREVLVKRYGQNNFEYVGNSKDDLTVWESSAAVHMVNPEFGVASKAAKLNKKIFYFEKSNRILVSAIKSMRLHQWIKNLLIFVPIIASHRFFEIQLLINGIAAFLTFSLCASSVYLLNDLLDLEDDRKHKSKRNRPLASGALPIANGLLLASFLLTLALSISVLLLPWKFTIILFGYYCLTISYSLSLKRVAILDAVVLSILYTTRVLAGAAAMSLVVTFWILAFSTFIFLSLALVKRYTEIFNIRNNSREKAYGRGYQAADFELLAALGTSSGLISVLVLALYINESATEQLYQNPEILWLAIPLLLFWLSRVWLIAHRGNMHEDPIIFALRDKVSQFTGLVFLVIFILAAL
jgi:4-hydroxybenzoate polyprenyltransferase